MLCIALDTIIAHMMLKLLERKLTRPQFFFQNFSCLSLFSHYQINYRFTSGRTLDFGTLCSKRTCKTPISCGPQPSRAKPSAEICSTRRANAPTSQTQRTRSSTSSCGTSCSARIRVYKTEMLNTRRHSISPVHSC